MDSSDIFDEIFNSDSEGILDTKKTQDIPTAEGNLISKFEQINDFIDSNGKEPEENLNNINEFKLYTRLKTLRNSQEKMNSLKRADRHKLFSDCIRNTTQEINTIEDIFDQDDLNILENDCSDIFQFKYISPKINIPDYISQRKKCENFEEYKNILTDCQQDLKKGTRKLIKFRNEQQINIGNFFVLNGILLYVVDVKEKEIDSQGRKNGRLYCVFENGTESDMLLRSLSSALYKTDGYRVTENNNKLNENFENNFVQAVSEKDTKSGLIYVLKSQSEKAEISSIHNLYKIGYTHRSIQERIRNAENEPTYLMAPVEYIAGWNCYNFSAKKLESLLHRVFGHCCLDIDILDNEGKRHTPREWFIVPLNIIEEAIELIIRETIVNYVYDSKKKKLVLKQQGG